MKTAELKNKIIQQLRFHRISGLDENKTATFIINLLEEYRTQPHEELPGDYYDYYIDDDTVDVDTVSYEAYKQGFLKMRSLASPIIASKDARIRELEEEKRRLEDDLGQKSMYYPDEPKN